MINISIEKYETETWDAYIAKVRMNGVTYGFYATTPYEAMRSLMKFLKVVKIEFNEMLQVQY